MFWFDLLYFSGKCCKAFVLALFKFVKPILFKSPLNLPPVVNFWRTQKYLRKEATVAMVAANPSNIINYSGPTYSSG